MGIEVAKATLDCCLLLATVSYQRRAKAVSNSRTGMAERFAWCAQHNAAPSELQALLEGPGVYHEQAALAVFDAGVTVAIVNPAQVKDVGHSLGIRTTTDGVDSFVLARYGASHKPRAWTPPAPEARTLPAWLSRREASAQD